MHPRERAVRVMVMMAVVKLKQHSEVEDRRGLKGRQINLLKDGNDFSDHGNQYFGWRRWQAVNPSTPLTMKLCLTH